MAAVVILILRVALSVALYGFLGWGFWLLWRDLRDQSRLISDRRAPRLTIICSMPAEELVRFFERSPVIIGRDPACECWVDDRTVSNRHAQLTYHHSQWWLEDLGSTNGTLLNGMPVTEPVVLMSGDQVRCGQVGLTIVIGNDLKNVPSASGR